MAKGWNIDLSVGSACQRLDLRFNLPHDYKAEVK